MSFHTNLIRSSRLYLLFIIASLTLLQGCAHYSQKTQGVRESLKSGRPDLALREFETQSHDSTDKVLTYLHKGMLKRMNGMYAESNRDFEVAKKEMADLYSTSVTQAVGSVVVNDAVRDYSGDHYEQVLLHAYMALNYIVQGKIDEARVEVLQADVKMREWGETPLEDPFVRYLSGIVFEALGEYDQALVAYRKAVEVYQKTKNQHGLPVPDQLKVDLLRMLAKEGLRNEYASYSRQFGKQYSAQAEKGMGFVVAILDNGLGPVKQEHSIFTWSPKANKRLKIALPKYPRHKTRTAMARVVVDGNSEKLETVENVDGMARYALQQDMPVITARALARMVIKDQAAEEAKKRGGGLWGLAFQIGGMATENADTRNWSTLPQEIQMVRIPLAPGNHELTIEMLGRSGYPIDEMRHPVSVQAGRITFVSDFWAAPRPKTKAQAATATASASK